MNNNMTIAEAFKLMEDINDREELIGEIQQMTGATRKSIVRKIGQLIEEGEVDKDEDFVEENIDEEEANDPFPFNTLYSNPNEDIDMGDSVKLALIKENSKLKTQLKKLSIERGGKNMLLEKIVSEINGIKPLPMIYKGDTNKKKSHATLVSLLSDFHIGSEEYIPGFNKFNFEIATRRVDLFLNKVLDWCELHRNSYIVDEICLVCLGDLISGDIHDELIRTNEFSSPEQVKRASELLSHIISSVAPHFKKVRVEFVVPDNHSRVTTKMQFADGTNSYNYLVGHLSKALVKTVPNVEFNIYPEIQQIIQIQERRYLIMHGNCVRGGSGGLFPMTGISRKLWRESHLRMNMPDNMHFDKILMGHYHSPVDTPDVSVAGCLVSSTGFDASAARHTPACITSFFVCGRYEFDYTPFWLNEGETY